MKPELRVVLIVCAEIVLILWLAHLVIAVVVALAGGSGR